MKYLFLSLALVALSASADMRHDPQSTLVTREDVCTVFAGTTATGQDARNHRVPPEMFEDRLKEIRADARFSVHARGVAIAGLRRGYAGLEDVDPDLMGDKAFDDCMAGKPLQ